VAHVGDSRLYLLRDESLHQLTTDHSLVQELVDDGQISTAQAAVHPKRHVLTRALGVEPSVDIDIIDIRPEYGDRYLLCSDGLSREASDQQIAAVMTRFADPSETAKELVALANSKGGSDNVTVVVIDVLANDSPEGLIAPGAGTTPEELGSPDGGEATAASPATRPGPGRPEGAEHRRRDSTAPRWLTWRVASFVAALCVVAGGAVACLAWYARSAYYVTLSDGRVTIFQGRPGGVLWFQPTLAERTALTPSSVPAYDLTVLQAGQIEPSLTDARLYISNLEGQKKEAEAVTSPHGRRGARSGPTSSTTAAPPGSRPASSS
jgi:protein phosphatase